MTDSLLKMRLILPVVFVMMLVVVACGDDNGGGDATPTHAVSVTTPGASFPPVDAEYFAISSPDVFAFFTRVLDKDEILEPVPNCTYDEPNIVIDCTESGRGTIALDIAPRGVVTECRGLVKPTTDWLFGASCNVQDGGAFVYEIVE